MKRFIIVLAVFVVSINTWCQKKPDIITISDIFKIITHHYIKYASETDDSKKVEKYYTSVLSSYRYHHGLIGDGFGGPCAIIDGFYKNGVNDKKNYRFIPSNRRTASVIYLSACENESTGDCGYLYVRLTIYSKYALDNIRRQMSKAGFKKFEYDNPETAPDSELYYSGNKSITISKESRDVWKIECNIAE